MMWSTILQPRWLPLVVGVSMKRNYLNKMHSFIIHQRSDSKCLNIAKRFSSSAAPILAEKLNPQISERISEIIKVLLSWPFKEHNLREMLLKNQHLLKYTLKSWKETVKFLVDYGFRPEQSLTLICRCPELLKCSTSNMLGQLQVLKSVGLSHDNVPSIVVDCPELLLIPANQILGRVSTLKTLITTEDIAKEIIKRPSILVEDWSELHKKINYIYSKMGLDQKEMLKGNIFKHSLAHIRLRHQFLSRAGVYYRPDNRGRTPIKNPSLRCIIDSSDDVFVKKFAKLSLEEYRIFNEILKLEIAQGLHDDDDDELDENDSEEHESDLKVEQLKGETIFEEGNIKNN